jgi:hypothetical protein
VIVGNPGRGAVTATTLDATRATIAAMTSVITTTDTAPIATNWNWKPRAAVMTSRCPRRR